ncbi:hypothetical protein J2Z66_008762 [Paenibacillus eucommiae]|uniref:Uncharacterized protein n=1 Tax=Paenibacillus eucommiae TaxID=1355755 RepID=A0ABS4JB55_9BACL|nr:hypothetical protein [Paenibacillus eucommiae]
MHTRSIRESDYLKIITVLNDWWGGRQMTHLLPKLFFEHFSLSMSRQFRVLSHSKKEAPSRGPSSIRSLFNLDHITPPNACT